MGACVAVPGHLLAGTECDKRESLVGSAGQHAKAAMRQCVIVSAAASPSFDLHPSSRSQWRSTLASSMMTNLTPRLPTLALMLLAATLLTDKAATAFIAGGVSSSGGSKHIGRHHNHYRPPTASSSPSALHSSVTWNNGNSYGKVSCNCKLSLLYSCMYVNMRSRQTKTIKPWPTPHTTHHSAAPHHTG